MNFSASKIPISFKGPTITGGPGSNVANAANAVNIGNAFQSLQKNGVQADQIMATGIATRADEKAQAIGLKADLFATKLAEKYGLQAAKLQADARLDNARDERNASLWQSGLKFAGTLGLGLLLSDRSTKENIEAIDDALSTLRNLRPVTYNYTEEWTMLPERLHHGFIAQEYKEVMPDATYYDEEYNKHCIDTSELIALLVRAVQQLETKVTRLEARSLVEA